MKVSRKYVAILVALSIVLLNMAFGNPTSNASEGMDERDLTITELLEERQRIIWDETVDIARLNAVDLELYHLGVNFLTEEEVLSKYPEAKASIDGKTENLDGREAASRAMDVPISSVNSWISYARPNYFYNGTYYNIDRLVVQPVSEDSLLWVEDAASVKYEADWVAGGTTFLKKVVSAGAAYIAPITSTVYDVLSSTIAAILPATSIDPDSVLYRWENSTTASFSYVRLQSEAEYMREYALVATSCYTSVAYIVDVDAWSLSGPVPSQIAGTEEFYSTPSGFSGYNRACYAYDSIRNGSTLGPISDRIYCIAFTGPETKNIVNIYPAYPEFPLGVE